MTANDHFKNSFSSWFWGSLILATGAHFALLNLWPRLTAQDFSVDAKEFRVMDIPPEVTVPPKPREIQRPAAPVISTAEIDEGLTIPRTTFEENPVGVLPPPPDSAATSSMAETPGFTPMTVRPDIKNRDELERALAREYPPLLRDAGIGGTAEVWFQIDEEGVVRQTLIKTGSGHRALDQAALQVAGIIEFTPALNRDKRVPVWISLPITFRVRQETHSSDPAFTGKMMVDERFSLHK